MFCLYVYRGSEEKLSVEERDAVFFYLCLVVSLYSSLFSFSETQKRRYLEQWRACMYVRLSKWAQISLME
jgi:hypothetical protein